MFNGVFIPYEIILLYGLHILNLGTKKRNSKNAILNLIKINYQHLYLNKTILYQ